MSDKKVAKCDNQQQQLPENDDVAFTQEKAEVTKMFLSCGIIFVGAFEMGTVSVFAATTFDKYSNESSTTLTEPLTESESSWFVSLMLIGLMIGILGSGAVADTIGRKFSLILSNSLLSVGLGFVFFATDFLTLAIGEQLCGIAVGSVAQVSYMLLSELSLIRHRGVLAAVNSVSICSGIVMAFITATFISDISLFILVTAVVPNMIFHVMSYFILESPMWHVSRGQVNKARLVLIELRGKKYPVDIELTELQEAVNITHSSGITGGNKLKAILEPPVLKPMAIMMVLFFFQAGSGSDSITNYALELFRASHPVLDSHILAVILESGNLSGYILSTCVTRKMGRKRQLITFGALLALMLAIIGFCIEKQASSQTHDSSSFLVSYALPSAVLFTSICYGLSYGPIPQTLLGELLPPKARGLCFSLALVTKFVTAFVILKVYPLAQSHMGTQGVFWAHALVAFTGIIYVFLFVPETRGLSWTQLAKLFHKDEESFSQIEKSVQV